MQLRAETLKFVFFSRVMHIFSTAAGHLTGGCQQKPCFGTLGQAQHVHCTQEACLEGFDGVIPSANTTAHEAG